MLLLAALTLFADQDRSTDCRGETTPAVEACLRQDLTKQETELARYHDAALARLRRNSAEDVANKFVDSQRRWLSYREAECGAVFADWSGGTIRGTMELDCEIRLTRLRTFAIWAQWLTYPDNTPPVLPRPPIASLLGER